MNAKEFDQGLTEAKKIARKLNDLLHEDALHRLQLYHEYSYEDKARWTPNLYHRCQLMEALCRKLNNIDLSQNNQDGKVKDRFQDTPIIAA